MLGIADTPLHKNSKFENESLVNVSKITIFA